jgi:hypothetical protein
MVGLMVGFTPKTGRRGCFIMQASLRNEREQKKQSQIEHKRRIEMTKYIARHIRYALSQLAATGFGMYVN